MFESRNELQANAEAFSQEAAAAAASLMNDCVAPRWPGEKTYTTEQQESALPSVTLTKASTNRPVSNSDGGSTKTEAAPKPFGELSEKGIGSIIEHLKQSTWSKINELAVPGRTPEQVHPAAAAQVDRTIAATSEEVSTKTSIENLIPIDKEALKGLAFWKANMEMCNRIEREESIAAESIAEKIIEAKGFISKTDKALKTKIEEELGSILNKERAISVMNVRLKSAGYEIRQSRSTANHQEYSIHGKNGAAISHIIIQR